MRTQAKRRVAVVDWQLIVFVWMLAVTKCAAGLSKYCPLMDPYGQMVYTTDIPWQTKMGVSKSECAMHCTFSYATSGGSGDVCRCFNYNSAVGNCSMFKKDPVQYAVDPFDFIKTFEVYSDCKLYMQMTRRTWTQIIYSFGHHKMGELEIIRLSIVL